MTRRDRLAMQLALAHLRVGVAHHGLTWAYGALMCGGEQSAAIIAALDAIVRTRDVVDNRTHRARLALAVRALLRAAAGDDGPVTRCYLCDDTGCAVLDGNCISDGGCCVEHRYNVLDAAGCVVGASALRTRIQYTPLWQACLSA